MPAANPRFSLRTQLIGVFSLLFATGLSILLVDELAERRSATDLATLKDESLAGQRRLMAVFDAYAVEIVGAVWKVGQGQMGWDAAASAIDNAAIRISLHAQALEAMPRSADQQLLFGQLALARQAADQLVQRIRALIDARDADGLRRLAEVELYPAFDPVTSRLRFLSDLELVNAERRVQRADQRASLVRGVRIALVLIMLGVSALIGRQILRNVFLGVDSLVKLARTLQARNFERAPGYRPRGELGEVMDAFLEMRGALRANEAELRESLQANETVRHQLQERELFQRSLLQAAQIAIFSVDGSGRFTHLNPFAEELLGYSADELVGIATPDILLSPAQLEQIAAELGHADEAPGVADWRLFLRLAAQEYPPLEHELRRRDGTTVPVLQAVSAMEDDDGQLIGLLFVATDLTELKKLEDELRRSEARAREANRAKSSFLAAMSHEIRTPLIGVTGMVEVLGHSRLDAEQRRSLEIIQQSADALLQIIGDVLDFSKIEAGRLELAPLPVALRDLLDEIANAHLASAASKGLALHCDIEAGVAAAHRVDPLRLRQVLGNFLSNAVKFTERGRIDLRLRLRDSGPDSQSLEFSVSDTGIGISQAAQKRLFSAFSQAEADTTRRFGGSGLGLVICQRLAELMGGHVELDSGEGVGTTLRLVLDLECCEAVSRISAGAAAGLQAATFSPQPMISRQAAEAGHALILLVDDHPTNRLVIERQLGLAGFRCETAEDGEQGLLLWRSGRFALVLTDLHMPRLDGFELARAIRAEEQQRGLPLTPIVALTAAALRGEADRSLAAGMNDFLTKPVTLEILAGCLRRWLPHLTAPPLVAREPADPASIRSPLQDGVLEEISGGDRAAARIILADFLDASEADMRALHAALARDDAEVATRSAHRLRGAARLVGASAIEQAASCIEDAGRVEDLAAIERELPQLDLALARLRLWADAQGAGGSTA